MEEVVVTNELAREKMVSEGCEGLRRSRFAFVIKGWAVGEAVCLVCGERIIYHLDIEDRRGKRVRRPVPRVHNGQCAHLHKLGLAQKRVKRYEKRRKA